MSGLNLHYNAVAQRKIPEVPIVDAPKVGSRLQPIVHVNRAADESVHILSNWDELVLRNHTIQRTCRYPARNPSPMNARP